MGSYWILTRIKHLKIGFKEIGQTHVKISIQYNWKIWKKKSNYLAIGIG